MSHVAARLKPLVKPRDRLLLGLSGGVDSIVLLDVLARLAKRMRFELRALHVNHQLSDHAAAWARFCRAACRVRGVPCRVVKVEIARGDSTERAAREARYRALAAVAGDFVLLAHNQDDQAETVLLQLLRGAGVKGLAAMPFLRATAPPIVRPLLEVPRSEIERYAKSRRLQWIEDESNADTQYTRNWLRLELVPRIAERVPAYRATLSRAARHFGEAASLLDDLARLDAEDAVRTGAFDVARLRSLTPARAKNVLRLMIAARGWAMPQAPRIEEALRQALAAKSDAAVRVNLGDCELRRHAGFLHLLPRRNPDGDDNVITWHGERELALPGLRGVLVMARSRGKGLSTQHMAADVVTVRVRQGGERLQPAPDRPRRTLKNLLQELGMPPWQRERLPLIFCGERLACVPGVGIDSRFQARPGEPSIVPEWRF